MLVYPDELNGWQLYQDHPAGQCFSAAGRILCSTHSLIYPSLVYRTHAHARTHARTYTHTPGGKPFCPFVTCKVGFFVFRLFVFWLIRGCFPVQQLIMSLFPAVWCIWYWISSSFKRVCWGICVSPLCCWLRAQPSGSCAVSLKPKYVHRKDGYTIRWVDR